MIWTGNLGNNQDELNRKEFFEDEDKGKDNFNLRRSDLNVSWKPTFLMNLNTILTCKKKEKIKNKHKINWKHWIFLFFMISRLNIYL